MTSTRARSPVNATSRLTIDTPALKGRLDCKPIDMSKISSWVMALDFTDKDAWNDARIPASLEIGYELRLGFSATIINSDGTSINWDNDHPYFSFFAADVKTQCCGTENSFDPQVASIAYWSPAGDAEHSSVVVKWVNGHVFGTPFIDSNNRTHLVWKEIPQVTALRCDPVYEMANTRVEVDVQTGLVQKYDVLDSPIPDPNAWSHMYQDLNVSTGVPFTNSATGGGFEAAPSKVVHNVSVRYVYNPSKCFTGTILTTLVTDICSTTRFSTQQTLH